MLRGLMVAVMVFGAGRAAVAEESTGIPSCDAFLAAYERCVASPGIPDAVRGQLRQAIVQMRGTYGSVKDPRAATQMGKSCLQGHAVTRSSLVQSFSCDFPPPDAAALAAAGGDPTVRGASDRAAAEERNRAREARRAPAVPPEEAKVQAYVEAQNYIVDSTHLERDLASYLRGNERVLRLGTKLGADAWYQFGINDYDTAIERLQKAIDKPGAVKGIDGAALELIKAFEAVNPIVKRLDRYQTTRAFQQDEYKLAREQHPLFVAAMTETVRRAQGFENALFDHEFARDEKVLASLPSASLARAMLSTSLASRTLLRAVDEVGPARAARNATALAAAVEEVARRNDQLAELMNSLKPKPNSYCLRYGKDLDEVVGGGRDLVKDVRTGGNPSQALEKLSRNYNTSVEQFAKCQRDEERARAG